MTQRIYPPSAVEAAETLGGLPTRPLEQIQGVWRQFPQIRWLKLYASRALGRQRPGSVIYPKAYRLIGFPSKLLKRLNIAKV
jgi:hypothetical protein